MGVEEHILYRLYCLFKRHVSMFPYKLFAWTNIKWLRKYENTKNVFPHEV